MTRYLPRSAGVHRPDLCIAINSCEHGFAAPSPLSFHDGQPHEVHAYGITSPEQGAEADLIVQACSC